MRLAILSDVHANLVALDAVLAHVGSVDAIWVLGDVVGYGPEPDAVVDRLRTLGATGVRGNHDRAAVLGEDIDWFNEDARAAIVWTRSRIDRATKDWLSALPDRAEEQGFTLVHGSPRDPTWEYIVSPPIAMANLGSLATAYCLFGHTHIPIAYVATDSAMGTFDPDDGDSLELDDRATLLNPGSVGQPRDGNSAASWLLLDMDAATATWRRTPYDIGATQAAMRAAGLPARLIARLELGV